MCTTWQLHMTKKWIGLYALQMLSVPEKKKQRTINAWSFRTKMRNSAKFVHLKWRLQVVYGLQAVMVVCASMLVFAVLMVLEYHSSKSNDDSEQLPGPQSVTSIACSVGTSNCMWPRGPECQTLDLPSRIFLCGTSCRKSRKPLNGYLPVAYDSECQSIAH